ncbi:MAG: CHAD domain-containing protein [Bacteroidales bacterium]|nr:CHAD domain-containing protein [Bacteroidales bacterium]
MEPDSVKLKPIKPALAGYIRESKSLLGNTAGPDENAIHDIRVLMKKSRAIMKLAASQLNKEYFERDLHELREVGRILRSWREASVHRKILKDLRKVHPDILSKLKDNEKLVALMKKTESFQELPEEKKEDQTKINSILTKAGYRLRFQSMNTIDPHLLYREFELTYAHVVDLFMTCRNRPRPKNLHEFRKKAKDFLYQLNFFRPLNPPVVKALEKKLDSMTQNLGKFNDLAQLIKTLDYKYPDCANQPFMDELIVMIRQKQDRYLGKVWPFAYDIFCPGQKLVNILGFKLLLI